MSEQKLPVSPAVDTAAGELPVLLPLAAAEPAEPGELGDEPVLAEEPDLGAAELRLADGEPFEQALSIRQSPAAVAPSAAAAGVDRSDDKVVPSFGGRDWPQRDVRTGSRPGRREYEGVLGGLQRRYITVAASLAPADR